MRFRFVPTKILIKYAELAIFVVSLNVKDVLAEEICLNLLSYTMEESEFVNGKVIALATEGTQLKVNSECPNFLKIDENWQVVVENAFNVDHFRELEKDVLTCSASVTCNEISESQTLLVYIYDENDERPYFNVSTPTSLALNEMMPSGWDIFNFESSICDDDNEDWFRRKTMTVNISNDVSGSFTLNATTKALQLRKTLDYEFGDTVINITLIIMDNRGHYSEPFVFSIIVTDGDDQPPIFTRSHYAINAYLQEWTQGSCISTTPPMIAYDGDVTINATIEYTIFTINDQRNALIFDTNCATKGQLRLVRPINGSSFVDFQVTVAATQADARDRVSYSYILVNVLPPLKMRQDTYRVVLPEDALPGSLVIVAEAVDRNKASNFSFELHDITSTFELAPSTGLPYAVIMLSNATRLDRESIASYVMTLTCRGIGSENATARLEVFISDVNDNAPLLNVTAVNLTVWEPELATDRLILALEAQDKDLGNNANLTIYLDGEAAQFLILVYEHDISGKVVAKVFSSSSMTTRMPAALRTTSGTAVLAFDVVASDHGSPSLEARCKVRLFVRPSKPVLLENVLEAAIKENELPNSTLATVRAQLDSEDIRVVFSIISGNEDTAFEVDSPTGDIRLSKVLNREEESVRVLRVQAQWADNQNFHSTTWPSIITSSDLGTVLITVIDVNEPPYFAHNYSVLVLAGTPSKTTVASVQAIDPDIQGTNNSRLFYFITKGNDDGLFSINPVTGEVKTTAPLPRDKGNYTIEVLSMDGGVPSLNASTVLLIHAIDDRQPRLLPENETYYVTVVENVEIGSPIIKIKTMIEGNRTGDVRYKLLSTGVPFRLSEAQDGLILTDSIIDREERNMWELIIVAYDASGATSSTATSKVTVTVADLNDNFPFFFCGNRYIQLVESEYSMALVANVTAYDLDEGSNGKVNYRFVQDSAAESLFIVLDGLLYINGSLDYENRTEHRLIVEASDSGNSPNNSTVEVLIIVIDSNDFCPVFDELNRQFDVPERRPWHAIAVLNATDNDGSVTFNRVAYELRKADLARDFYLDNQNDGSAILRTLTGLQFSLNNYYEVTIRAYDVAKPDCFSEKTMELTVLKANETNSENVTLPVFEEVVYRIPVPWNATSGEFLFQFRTRGSTEHIYAIRRGNERNLFSINETSGELSLNTDAMELGRGAFLLTIAARNPSDVSTESAAVAHLMIGHPLFNQSIYNAHIEEEAKCSLALLLTATPFYSTSKVHYAISSGNEDGAFKLDENTGNLSCAKVLDREKKKFYTLTVTVHQTVGGRFASEGNAHLGYDTSVVNIWVTDKNDNDPQFAKALEFNIDGRYNANDVLANIEATDADECQNIIFQLLNEDKKFGIYPNGSLYSKGGQIEAPVTTLKIVALDNCYNVSRQSTADVTLIVNRPDTVTPKGSRWLEAVNKAIEGLEQSHMSILNWNVYVSRRPESHREPSRLKTSLYAMKDGGLFVESTEFLSQLDKTITNLDNSYDARFASDNAENYVVYILAAVSAALALLVVVFLSWGCTWRRKTLRKRGNESPHSRDANAEDGSSSSRLTVQSTTAPSSGIVPAAPNGPPAILVQSPDDGAQTTRHNPSTIAVHLSEAAVLMAPAVNESVAVGSSSSAAAVTSSAECEPQRQLPQAAEETRLAGNQLQSATADRSEPTTESHEQQETPQQFIVKPTLNEELGEYDWPAPPEPTESIADFARGGGLTVEVQPPIRKATFGGESTERQPQILDGGNEQSCSDDSASSRFPPGSDVTKDENRGDHRAATTAMEPDHSGPQEQINSVTEDVRL